METIVGTSHPVSVPKLTVLYHPQLKTFHLDDSLNFGGLSPGLDRKERPVDRRERPIGGRLHWAIGDCPARRKTDVRRQRRSSCSGK